MERIHQKIGRIKEHLSLVRSIKDDCLLRFTKDPLYRGAILHYLYLLADSCIVLAELVIKHKNLRTPQSYSEAFDILGENKILEPWENKILEPSFAYKFARIAGFRNFLAHDYERIVAEIICKEAMSKLEEIDSFIEQIENALREK